MSTLIELVQSTYTAIFLVTVGIFYVSAPMWLYLIKKLSFGRTTSKLGNFFISVLALLAVVFFIWVHQKAPEVGEVFVRLFYVEIVLIVLITFWRFLNRHFVKLAEEVWGNRVFSFDLLAGLLKLVSLFIAIFSILTIFRLSFDSSWLESGTAGLITGLLSASFFAPYLKKIVNVVSLMVTKPYAEITKGDYVEINSKTGKYDHATLHVTILKASDGHHIPVDNQAITHGNVYNYTTRTHLRREWEFRFDADTTGDRLEAVEKRIRQTIDGDPDCDLVSSRYVEGTTGFHKLLVSFDVKMDPRKLDLVNERANDVYRDCTNAVHNERVEFHRSFA